MLHLQPSICNRSPPMWVERSLNIYPPRSGGEGLFERIVAVHPVRATAPSHPAVSAGEKSGSRMIVLLPLFWRGGVRCYALQFYSFSNCCFLASNSSSVITPYRFLKCKESSHFSKTNSPVFQPSLCWVSQTNVMTSGRIKNRSGKFRSCLIKKLLLQIGQDRKP